MQGIAELRSQILGQLLLSGEPGYDAARRVRNARIDRFPAAILRCQNTRDIQLGIRWAQQQALPIAVRGGGAHVAGYGTCDQGLLLDLSLIKTLIIDEQQRQVSVGPGVTWGELDALTQQYGLAVPGPRNPTIGVAGHTLGGGVGDLSRQFGLTSDNLLSCELITATGDLVEVDANTQPDLFWGLRGAGANFGVVSRFTFQLHPVTGVVAGALAWPASEIKNVIRRARDWLLTAPDQASLIAIIWTAPPLAFLPETLHFERSIMLIPTWFGAPEKADEVLAVLRAGADWDNVRQMSYIDYQTLLPSSPDYHLQHVYNRGELLETLNDDTLDALLTLFNASGPNFSLVFGALGGAISRAPAGETAFTHRRAQWFVETCAQWYGAADHPHMLEPAKAAWLLLQPVSCGPYANLLPDHDPQWARATYGDAYARLSRLKQRWDPQNTFCFNVNIDPVSLNTPQNLPIEE